LSDIEIIQIG